MGKMTIPDISDIFQKKLDEIQSRGPVTIKGSSDNGITFEKYLKNAASAVETTDVSSMLQVPQQITAYPTPSKALASRSQQVWLHR